MRKTQENQLRQMRRKLGDAMRRADDVVGPIKAGLIDQGYRWEPEDVLDAMIVLDDLMDESGEVLVELARFVNQYENLTEVELEWLVGPRKGEGGALGRLREGIKVLKTVSGKKLIELENKFFEEGTAPNDGHEAYFLRRFGQGMRLLRKAWVFIFYATARPKRPVRVKLTARETKGFYNPLTPGIRDKILSDAQEAANERANFVEIYADDGALVYVALPPETMREAEMRTAARGMSGKVKPRITWEHRRREPTPGMHLAADVSPEQAEAIREIVIRRPGTSLRDAAAQVGVEVAEVAMTPNARYSDAVMFYDLFGMDY